MTNGGLIATGIRILDLKCMQFISLVSVSVCLDNVVELCLKMTF